MDNDDNDLFDWVFFFGCVLAVLAFEFATLSSNYDRYHDAGESAVLQAEAGEQQ